MSLNLLPLLLRTLMHLPLLLLLLLTATTVRASPVRLDFDAIVVSGPASFGRPGDTISGNFWFNTDGRVHMNTLLDFPGREMGYTFVAPAQSGGIQIRSGHSRHGSTPVLQAEMRNYDPALTDRADEFEIRARSVFESVSIVFQGADASFFEQSGHAVQVPRFSPDMPFLEYSEGYVRLSRPRRFGIDLVARIVLDSIDYFGLLDRDPSASGPEEPPVPPPVVPEPSTAVLLLLGLLGIGAGRSRSRRAVE